LFPLVECTTVGEVKAQVGVLVAHVEACAKAILALGVNIDVDAEVKADIAAKIAAIIAVRSTRFSAPVPLTHDPKIIVQACLSVSVKFGIVVVLAIFAPIDVCLRLLISNLDICVVGIVAVIVKS
jgi:hypothetical protein